MCSYIQLNEFNVIFHSLLDLKNKFLYFCCTSRKVNGDNTCPQNKKKVVYAMD